MYYTAFINRKVLTAADQSRDSYENQLIDTIGNDDKYFSALEYVEQTKSNNLGIK
ncbi:MAG TPA: hypothetical protein VKA98_08660 [Nitrososphaeraceae archaeon]|nr:hypothetical protein [Nitrososphaeraceae archaeon]